MGIFKFKEKSGVDFEKIFHFSDQVVQRVHFAILG